MKNLMLLTMLLFSISGSASQSAPTPEEFQAMLKLDYKAFDQSQPNGGWRGIADNVEAGKVLDAYNVQHRETLTPSQLGIITWHAGQTYAFANLNDLAIARFKKSFNKDESPTDTFKWNSYVKGSIAFLEHDMKKLIESRDELRAVNKIEPNGNLKFLEAFARCFKKTYSEAYGTDCK